MNVKEYKAGTTNRIFITVTSEDVAKFRKLGDYSWRNNPLAYAVAREFSVPFSGAGNGFIKPMHWVRGNITKKDGINIVDACCDARKLGRNVLVETGVYEVLMTKRWPYRNRPEIWF